MSWLEPLELQEAPLFREWTTNDEIWDEWQQEIASRHAPNTVRNLTVYPRVFFDFYTTPVTKLSARDLQKFVDHLSKKCKHFKRGSQPKCNKKIGLSKCPMMDGHGCPRYTALKPSALKSYLDSIHQMYAWLLEQGQIKTNPCTAVRRAFMYQHKRFFEDAQRDPDRHNFTTKEIRRLIKAAPPHWAFMIAMMAKYYLRVHEVLKLSLSPEYFNEETREMRIPHEEDNSRHQKLGRKRRGNDVFVLDDEAMHLLHKYGRWVATRFPTIESPTTMDVACLNAFGKPWAPTNLSNLDTQLKKLAKKARIRRRRRNGKPTSIVMHGFRAYATTRAYELGASERDVSVMRGDLGNPTHARYDNQRARIQQLYEDYPIKLGI